MAKLTCSVSRKILVLLICLSSSNQQPYAEQDPIKKLRGNSVNSTIMKDSNNLTNGNETDSLNNVSIYYCV